MRLNSEPTASRQGGREGEMPLSFSSCISVRVESHNLHLLLAPDGDEDE